MTGATRSQATTTTTTTATAITTTAAALLVGRMTEMGEASEGDPIHHGEVTCVLAAVVVAEMDLFLVAAVRGE